MAKQGSNNFYVGSSKVESYTGASDFNTLGIDLTQYQSGWILYAESDHTTGTPTITIQVSRDNTNWLNYITDAIEVLIPITIQQSYFRPKYIRLQYIANSSDGDVTFKFDKVDE
jgi:hypothetical protein|tara:strand:- start:576 stop:917 length:342 start_codon:yes stop_codon:yes gene_type:complete